MKLKYISGMVSVLLGVGLVVAEANAGFVTLPTAVNTPGCNLASAPLLRCVGTSNVATDILYIAPVVKNGVYSLPSTLSLISQVDTNFFVNTVDGQPISVPFAGTFSDYVFMDTTTNSVVIGSRLYFGAVNGSLNLSEANDIFRYGYDGFKVEAGWTRLSSSDWRTYSVARSEVGLKQGADVYNSNVVGFRSDINASESHPQSGLYLIRTDATAFKVINNAIKIRQGGEESQTVLSVSLSGYAPTKLDTSGIGQNETIKTYGGTYTANMNVSGNLNVAYGNSQFNGNVAATSGSKITVDSGATATFNGLFNQQVGSTLNGGGTYVFNGGYSPGNSPGAVSVTGNVVFGTLNDALFELAGLLKGDEYDHLTVDGNLTFGGVLRLSFINGFKAKAGDTFDLFDWTTATGTFSSISTQNALLGTGLAWNFDNLYTTGSVSVVATTPVPEPESSALIALGLGLVAMVTRRKKKLSN